MTVAVLLLGVPMGVFGALMVNEASMANLELRTQSVSRSVEARLATGSDIDEAMLERWVDDGDIPVWMRVTSPTGRVVEVGEPIEGRTTYRNQYTASGAHVSLHIASSRLFWQGAQVVILVVLASLIAVGTAALVASWQARRLAAPLVFLAASAEQVGAGQARPQFEPSGVEEIDLVAAELNRTGDRMASRLVAERQFAANASHQLRTPLTALSMRLEEIQLLSDDEAVREEARISLEQLERLVRVVDDLLAASRSRDGGTTQPLPLDEVFDQQEDEWEGSFRRAGRQLIFENDDDLAVLVTPGAIAQVLSTLLENSLKYGEGTTSVRARPSKPGAESGVVIEVADEGPGVSDDLAPRIFERHVTSGKGSGLGLSLARDLIAADGGRLDLAQRRPPVFNVFLNAVPKRLDPEEVLPAGSVVVVGRRRRRR
ncbi:ATP-binding protein [Pseudactinotalea sp. Z1732]|uniref:ATP-binding protein n=1 Tax=Micrococcales TaxID=85006 RepID=UPI003C7EA1EC